MKPLNLTDSKILKKMLIKTIYINALEKWKIYLSNVKEFHTL